MVKAPVRSAGPGMGATTALLGGVNRCPPPMRRTGPPSAVGQNEGEWPPALGAVVGWLGIPWSPNFPAVQLDYYSGNGCGGSAAVLEDVRIPWTDRQVSRVPAGGSSSRRRGAALELRSDRMRNGAGCPRLGPTGAGSRNRSGR